MPNLKPTFNKEIDLLQLFDTIWNGKWIIVLFVMLAISSVYGYFILNPNSNFTATTVIKPLTSVENDKYKSFNNYIANLRNIEKKHIVIGDNRITSDLFLKLFLSQMSEGTIFEKGIRKFNLIKIDEYIDENQYNDAVVKLASQIQLEKPGKKLNYHELRFVYHDFDKWKKFLKYTIKEQDKAVQKIIIDRFKDSMKYVKQQKKFLIDNLKININNEILRYKNETRNKLAYLKEQAYIARKLNVKSNSIGTQLFNSENSILTNIRTDDEFYMRGYDAIEEQIILIQKRKSIKSFIPKIFMLEEQIKSLENNDSLKRAENLFAATPISQNNFRSAIIKVPSTKYIFNKSPYLYYAISIFFGMIIGTLYVLISYTFRNRKRNIVLD